MSLAKRSLRKKFSTFKGSGSEWSSPNSTLLKNIERLLNLEDFRDAKEETVALYFVKCLSSSNEKVVELSRQHLIAYAQEHCYHACKELCKKFNKNEKDEIFEDCFQAGNMAICQVNFFTNYRPQSGNTLGTYISNAVKKKAIEILTGGGNNVRSNWGLLAIVSKKQIKEILPLIPEISSGREQQNYIQIHKFYKEICKPSKTGKKREKPSEQQLQAICDCFNKVYPHKLQTEEALEMLRDCIAALREQQNFIDSRGLDAPLGGEDNSTLLIDTISYDSEPNIIDEGDDSYFGSIREGLVQIVAQDLDSLDNDKQGKFTFLHGFDCTTTEVANLYKVNQSTISRLYNPIVESCLNYSKTFVSDFTDDTFLIKALRDWLKQHLAFIYTSLLYEVVDSLVMSQLHKTEISFLNDLRVTGRTEQLAQNLNQSTEYINEERKRLKDAITGLVVNHLKTNFNILAPLYPVAPKIDEFIDKWMCDRPTN